MTDLTVPDISEFQGNIDWPTLAHAHPAVIVRADNGYGRADFKWATNAAAASKLCQWWGAYQYLPASADPAAAARHFVATLGNYRPNALILDLEEGTGDQRARRATWISTVHALLPAVADWTYSGLYFARAHLPGVGVDWLAAYQGTEPTDHHTLWQQTDRRTVPGVAAPCDASAFHGSVADLIRATSTSLPGPASPIPTIPPEDDMPYTPAEIEQYAGIGVHGQEIGRTGITIGTALERTLNGVVAAQAQIAALTSAVQQLASSKGAPVDLAAITAAAEKAVRDVLGSLDNTAK